MDKIKNIGIFLLYFLGFILGPSLIYTIFYLFNMNEDMLLMVLSNLIYSIILFIILRKKIISDFKKLKENKVKNFELVLKSWGVGLLLMMVSNMIINFIIFDGSISANEESVRAFIKDYLILSGISSVILAPFSEEITFRYAVKKIFKNKWLYIIFSGVIFGFLHAISGIETAKDLIDLVYIIPYGALGSAFAYVYSKTDNICLPILGHMCHNLMTFLLIVLFM